MAQIPPDSKDKRACNGEANQLKKWNSRGVKLDKNNLLGCLKDFFVETLCFGCFLNGQRFIEC